MWDEKKLLEICETYSEGAPKNVVFPEPYIPYVRDPEKWNKILVLAESQNIGIDDDYYKWLKKLKPTERMKRLGWKNPPPYTCPDKSDWIGVGPWDGGLGELVKSALRAIFEKANLKLKVEDVAVSNAVPWTKKRSGSRNESSDKEMRCKARNFWKEIFGVWNPDLRMIIVLGKKAEEVMNGAGILQKYNGFEIRHPSRAKKISYNSQAIEKYNKMKHGNQ